MRRPLPFALLVTAGFLLDQLSKALVFRWVPPKTSVPLIQGLFHISSCYNSGVAFGFLKDYPGLVLAFSALAVPALAYWYVRDGPQAPAAKVWCQGLLLAGASGNLLDRVLPPYQVRDFVEFVPRIPGVGKWGIFNVADVCICVGVGLLLWSEMRKPHGEGEGRKDEG